MDYQETLDYLYSQLPMYQRIGKAAYKADLDNTIALCRLLGNPERSFKSIHIAGTNGKGSTAHYLASIMQEYGLKTGLYTSPHLVDFRERIRIDDKKVPEEFVIDFVNNHRESFREIQPSFFEMTAGMAFAYFGSEKVDIAIIETGMGGRLDSTNVIRPEISVITNIGYDHMQFLGNTLEKIAREKAAIIKRGIPVVIGEKQENVKDIFIEKARGLGSDIIFAVDDWLFANELMKDLESGPPVEYQKKNIATALVVIRIFNSQGNSIRPDQMKKGIEKVAENTGLMGRWQIIARQPLIICDVGHNYDGLMSTMQQLDGLSYDNLHFVFGSVNDKELGPVFRLLPGDAQYYFCKPDIPRGLDQHELELKARKSGLSGQAYDSVMEAYGHAVDAADEGDLIFVGGSTFVVADLLAGIDIIPR